MNKVYEGIYLMSKSKLFIGIGLLLVAIVVGYFASVSGSVYLFKTLSNSNDFQGLGSYAITLVVLTIIAFISGVIYIVRAFRK
jgi:hypothetical protein